MTGYFLASALFLKDSKAGTALVVAGSVLAIAAGGWPNLVAYLTILAGFTLNFRPWRREEVGAGVDDGSG